MRNFRWSKAFWRIVALLLSFFFLDRGAAWSQDCSAILANGVWESSNTYSSIDKINSFLNWSCSHQFSSWSSYHDAGINLGIPIGDLPLSLNGHDRDQQWSQYQNDLCALRSGFGQYQNTLITMTSKASPEITTAWTRCVTNPGFQAWLESTRDPKIFIVSMVFNSLAKKKLLYATLNKKSGLIITPNSTECTPRVADVLNDRDSREIGVNGERLSCHRVTNDPVTVTFNADVKTPDSLSLAKYEEPVPLTTPTPPPSITLGPGFQGSAMLYLGIAPNCNAGIVANNPGHLGCAAVPIGNAVAQGSASQTALYLGVSPNVNAGFIMTIPGWRGGQTVLYGYTVSNAYKTQKSVPLYVITSTNPAAGCNGQVSSNPEHQNCQGTPIGYTYW